MRKRDKKGRFIRTIDSWTPDKWGVGYYDNRGRFRVYRPDYPRAYGGGYALRAHVVFWLYHGRVHSGELHHINKDMADDRIENLMELSNSMHQKTHKSRPVECVCEYCQKCFTVPAWRIRSRKVRFCSQKCYRSMPRKKKRVKIICIQCGKPFYVTPYRAKFRKLCSPKCTALYRWPR